jgi:hypothetical protein
MVEEGFANVKGARDRYDGIPRPLFPRNPWNKTDRGGHYSRTGHCTKGHCSANLSAL